MPRAFLIDFVCDLEGVEDGAAVVFAFESMAVMDVKTSSELDGHQEVLDAHRHFGFGGHPL